MSYQRSVFILHITIPLLIAAICAFLISDFTSSPKYTEKIVSSIDDSRDNVLKLAASSTAVAVAITALPGDLATPVAENLADLSKGFLIVLCALYLEKFLVSVTGVVAFRWLVPIACFVYIFGFVTKKPWFQKLAYKLACFAVIFFMIIPVGAAISGMIQEKYGDSINETIASAESCADQIKDSVEKNGSEEESQAGNGLGQILKNLQQTGDKLARGTSQFMKYLEKLVNHYIEVIAIMLVTSCVIPLLVFLCFYWISKWIFLADSSVKEKLVEIMKTGEKVTEVKE